MVLGGFFLWLVLYFDTLGWKMIKIVQLERFPFRRLLLFRVVWWGNLKSDVFLMDWEWLILEERGRTWWVESLFMDVILIFWYEVVFVVNFKLLGWGFRVIVNCLRSFIVYLEHDCLFFVTFLRVYALLGIRKLQWLWMGALFPVLVKSLVIAIDNFLRIFSLGRFVHFL